MLMAKTDTDQSGSIEDFISIAKARKLSGYSEQYLRRLAKDGQIYARKFGFFWMFERASLEAYLQRAHSKNEKDKRFGPREFE